MYSSTACRHHRNRKISARESNLLRVFSLWSCILIMIFIANAGTLLLAHVHGRQREYARACSSLVRTSRFSQHTFMIAEQACSSMISFRANVTLLLAHVHVSQRECYAWAYLSLVHHASLSTRSWSPSEHARAFRFVQTSRFSRNTLVFVNEHIIQVYQQEHTWECSSRANVSTRVCAIGTWRASHGRVFPGTFIFPLSSSSILHRSVFFLLQTRTFNKALCPSGSSSPYVVVTDVDAVSLPISSQFNLLAHW